jgi:hypothetical protein
MVVTAAITQQHHKHPFGCRKFPTVPVTGTDVQVLHGTVPAVAAGQSKASGFFLVREYLTGLIPVRTFALHFLWPFRFPGV